MSTEKNSTEKRFDKFLNQNRDEMQKYFSDMRTLLESDSNPDIDPIDLMITELKNREFNTEGIPPSEYEFKLFFIGICTGIVLQELAEKEKRIQGIIAFLDALGGKE